MHTVTCVFTYWRGSLAHKEDAQGFRETVVIAVDSDISATVTLTSTSAESHSLGILTTFSLLQNITSVRTLKFNDISVIVQLLSLRSFRLHEDKRKILLSDTNCLKYRFCDFISRHWYNDGKRLVSRFCQLQASISQSFLIYL